MTNEEAKTVLINSTTFIKDCFKYMKDEHVEQFKEAYRTAIEALRQISMTAVQEACRTYRATIIVDVDISDEEAGKIKGGDMRLLFGDLRLELNSCWHGVELKKVTIEELNCSMEGYDE